MKKISFEVEYSLSILPHNLKQQSYLYYNFPKKFLTKRFYHHFNQWESFLRNISESKDIDDLKIILFMLISYNPTHNINFLTGYMVYKENFNIHDDQNYAQKFYQRKVRENINLLEQIIKSLKILPYNEIQKRILSYVDSFFENNFADLKQIFLALFVDINNDLHFPFNYVITKDEYKNYIRSLLSKKNLIDVFDEESRNMELMYSILSNEHFSNKISRNIIKNYFFDCNEIKADTSKNFEDKNNIIFNNILKKCIFPQNRSPYQDMQGSYFYISHSQMTYLFKKRDHRLDFFNAIKNNSLYKSFKKDFNTMFIFDEYGKILEGNVYSTGNSINSMYNGKKINDYDIFFSNKETAFRVIQKLVDLNPHIKNIFNKFLVLDEKDGYHLDLKNEIECLEIKTSSNSILYKAIFTKKSITFPDSSIQLVFSNIAEPQILIKDFDFIHCQFIVDFYADQFFAKYETILSILSLITKVNKDNPTPVKSVFRYDKYSRNNVDNDKNVLQDKEYWAWHQWNLTILLAQSYKDNWGVFKNSVLHGFYDDTLKNKISNSNNYDEFYKLYETQYKKLIKEYFFTYQKEYNPSKLLTESQINKQSSISF